MAKITELTEIVSKGDGDDRTEEQSTLLEFENGDEIELESEPEIVADGGVIDGYDLAEQIAGDGISTTIVTERYVKFQADDVRRLEQADEEIPDPWETEFFYGEDGTPTLSTHVDTQVFLEANDRDVATDGGEPVDEIDTSNMILDLVARGCSPAEAVDYYATEIECLSQATWAAARGLSGHQSVGRNARSARDLLEEQDVDVGRLIAEEKEEFRKRAFYVWDCDVDRRVDGFETLEEAEQWLDGLAPEIAETIEIISEEDDEEDDEEEQGDDVGADVYVWDHSSDTRVIGGFATREQAEDWIEGRDDAEDLEAVVRRDLLETSSGDKIETDAPVAEEDDEDEIEEFDADRPLGEEVAAIDEDLSGEEREAIAKLLEERLEDVDGSRRLRDDFGNLTGDIDESEVSVSASRYSDGEIVIDVVVGGTIFGIGTVADPESER